MMSSNGADEIALQRSYSDAQPINKITAERLMNEVKQIMDNLGVAFFLRQGTCLGAIRDEGFMPWDDDVDLGSIIGLNGLTESVIETVASAFQDNGFFMEIERNSHYINLAMMKSSIRIDWTAYRIIDESIVHYPAIWIPIRLFTSLKEIDFIGAKFLVPNPPEEYLSLKYGPEWMTPKKPGDYEADVLQMATDAPISPVSDNSNRESHRSGGKLRVLNYENEPVFSAKVRIVGVGHFKTNKLGYANFNLPADGWYALNITYDNHEEVLYMEKMNQDQAYTYRPDPSIESGRTCVLSAE